MSMLKVYHFTYIYAFQRIWNSGALLPTSYPDIHKCEWVERRIFGKDRCRHNHPYVPNVLWLTTLPGGTHPACAPELLQHRPDLRERPEWERDARIRFTAVLPAIAVHRWHDYALRHGADPEWVKQQSPRASTAVEYVTTTQIPSGQWLEIKDTRTGNTITRDAAGNFTWRKDPMRQRVVGVSPYAGVITTGQLRTGTK
jgi:hypothetical protein